MIKVMIVGQKWLAEQLLELCTSMVNVDVVLISVPCIDDRASLLATKLNVPVIIHDKTLLAGDVPNDIDIILMAHAHCFVNADARDKAKHGAVGYHPSLLPLYKGITAIEDAFNASETITGGSLYQLDDGWDTGFVIDQGSVTISSDDTIKSLWQDKLAPLGLELFNRYLKEMK